MNAEKILGSAVPTPSATTSPGRSAANVKMDISLAVMGGPARVRVGFIYQTHLNSIQEMTETENREQTQTQLSEFQDVAAQEAPLETNLLQ